MSIVTYKKLEENNQTTKTTDGLVYSNIAVISLLILLTVYKKNISTVNVELLNMLVSATFYIFYFSQNAFTKNLLISTIAMDCLLLMKISYDVSRYFSDINLAMLQQQQDRIIYDFQEFNSEMP